MVIFLMLDEIDWNSQFTCHICNETYVRIPKPKVDIEKFITDEPCSGCGHKSLSFE